MSERAGGKNFVAQTAQSPSLERLLLAKEKLVKTVIHLLVFSGVIDQGLSILVSGRKGTTFEHSRIKSK